MKKLILALLLVSSAQADVFIQRLTSEQLGNGYMYAFQQGEVIVCLGIPDVLDVTLIPPTWMRVTDAATMYGWPYMTGVAAEACASPPPVPRTKGGPMYTINPHMRVEEIRTVPAGVPCGDKIMWANFFYAVYYDGTYGFSACS